MRSRSLLVSVAAIILTIGGLASPAAAAVPAWTPPIDVTAVAHGATYPEITLAPNGTLVAVWLEQFASATAYDVFASRSTDNGLTWSTPAQLSVTGGSALLPQVTSLPNGTIVAAWSRYISPTGATQVSRSIDNGLTWSTPVDLWTSGNANSWTRLAAAADGSVTVVGVSPTYTIETSTSTDGGLTWPVSTQLSAGMSFHPQIAIAADGMRTAAWIHVVGGQEVQTSSSPDGVTWTAPVTVTLGTPSGRADISRVAIGADGTRTIVWGWSVSGDGVAQATTSAAGSTSWSLPANMSVAAPDVDASDVQVSIAPNGTRTAVWILEDTDEVVQVARSANGITWSTPISLSTPGGTAANPDLVTSADGTLTVTWAQFTFPNADVQTRSSTDGGVTWSAAITLSVPGSRAGQAQPALDANGSPLVIWGRTSATAGAIQVSLAALPAAVAPAAGLASGGFDVMPYGIAAALLLGLGAALVLRRRGSLA